MITPFERAIVCLSAAGLPWAAVAALEDAVEFAIALGPAGEIIRLAGDEGRRRKGQVVAALRETLALH